MLMTDLKQLSTSPQGLYVTPDNVEAVNALFAKWHGRRPAQCGHYADFGARVLWSNDAHGYGRETTRVCTLRNNP